MKYTYIKNQKVAKSLAECLHNLSLDENNNENITDEQIAKYGGFVQMAISVIMATTGKNFFYAMLALNEILPLATINLELVFPASWCDCLKYGQINIDYCQKLV